MIFRHFTPPPHRFVVGECYFLVLLHDKGQEMNEKNKKLQAKGRNIQEIVRTFVAQRLRNRI